ncbi:MAG: MFS transporter [Pseudomonadota bacterium]
MERKRKLFWIVVLYLSQGFPFGVITFQLPFYFRTHGLSLDFIGLLALLQLPWSLKMIWAPLVDRYGQRKHWVAAMQGVMAFFFFLLPTQDAASPTPLLFLALIALPFASATADIAIDAYTIEILKKDEVASANAARMISWKIAYVFATGIVGTVASRFGWNWAYIFCGFFLVWLIPITLAAPDSRLEIAPSETRTTASFFSSRFWLEGYGTLMGRSGILLVLLFVLTYKLGSATIGPMISPFWHDRHFSPQETGWVSGAVGSLESIAAPLVAAWFISKLRLFHALWVFAFLQMAPALLYAAVAHWDLGRPAIYAASLSQSFDLSLANVAFASFLMMICDKKYAATQYAMLTCLFALTRSVAGGLGGFAAQRMGYAPFFLAAFFLGFVSFLFLPAVRRWIDAASKPPAP